MASVMSSINKGPIPKPYLPFLLYALSTVTCNTTTNQQSWYNYHMHIQWKWTYF